MILFPPFMASSHPPPLLAFAGKLTLSTFTDTLTDADVH
ncbi:hypothetical protein EST38_g12682 [Candolleomyces aberdarensis]|uniref:Uncharacterized protein n=1 Tax=Candolleomyces aberdarensis TaxID=2316362 RepID=A0A4Q2D425_9AGAR|nr:hypothetical protein EST38_g12682 [Candolleomyces aberdarensis]